jgi:hypothetical protein
MIVPGHCTNDMIDFITKIMALWFTVYVLSYEEFLIDGNGMKHLGRWKPMAAIEACLHVAGKTVTDVYGCIHLTRHRFG